MEKYTEDVDVRCRTCGKRMGNVTVRSDSKREFDKIVWMNKNLIRCTECAAVK